ncbi:DNA methyltransferase [Bacillus sp. AL-1R]
MEYCPLSGYGERHVKKEGTIRNPVTVLEELIAIQTNEGKSVLDCFMGSGSTGQAALNLNTKFIGLTFGI